MAICSYGTLGDYEDFRKNNARYPIRNLLFHGETSDTSVLIVKNIPNVVINTFLRVNMQDKNLS